MAPSDIGSKLAELSTKFDIMLSNQEQMSKLLDRLDREKQGLEKQLIRFSDKLDALESCKTTYEPRKVESIEKQAEVLEERTKKLEKRADTLEKRFIRAAGGFALTLLSGILSWIGWHLGGK